MVLTALLARKVVTVTVTVVVSKVVRARRLVPVVTTGPSSVARVASRRSRRSKVEIFPWVGSLKKRDVLMLHERSTRATKECVSFCLGGGNPALKRKAEQSVR